MRGVPRSNSTIFAPLSQCSPCFPWKTMRDVFHWPTGTRLLRAVRRDEIVEGTREVRRNLVVVAQGVVEHLILEAERRMVRRVRQRKLLGDVVFHAAVGAGRDLPLEGELEVAERVDRHQVPAVRRLTVRDLGHLAAGNLLDRAVHDAPMRRRNRVVPEPAPPFQRLPVEEQPPSRGSLGRRQRVRRRLGEDRCRQGESQEPTDWSHAVTIRRLAPNASAAPLSGCLVNYFNAETRRRRGRRGQPGVQDPTRNEPDFLVNCRSGSHSCRGADFATMRHPERLSTKTSRLVARWSVPLLPCVPLRLLRLLR